MGEDAHVTNVFPTSLAVELARLLDTELVAADQHVSTTFGEGGRGLMNLFAADDMIVPDGSPHFVISSDVPI
jgi:hypothetical protein